MRASLRYLEYRGLLPAAGRQRPYQGEENKASVPAKVEHPFRTIKRQFGYAKVRYQGVAKNANQLYLLAASERYILA